MDNFEVGVWLAIANLAEPHRQADQRRRDRAPGSLRLPDRHGQAADRTGGGRPAAAAVASGPRPAITEAAMLTQHQHQPEEFDPGHCRTCARQAGLLDHYDHVRREETRPRQTRMWARAGRRYAIWALCSSAGSILLAAVALLTR